MSEQNSDSEVELASLLRELADAGPVPPEAADRFDETIARLAAARTASAVSNLDVVRRRRRWTMGVAAAASAAIVGVGLTSLTHGDGQIHDSLTGARAQRYSAQAEVTPSAPVSGSQDLQRGSGTGGASVAEPHAFSASAGIPAFTSRGFSAEVSRWFAAGHSEPLAWAGVCGGPGIPTVTRAYAATFDGQAAALVVYPPRSGVQAVQIFTCPSDGAPLATTTVPAR